MSHTIAGFDVAFTDANPNFHHWWTEFKPSTQLLPKGWRREPDRLALKEDLIWEKDVAIPLRDGVCLRADVFRPANLDGQKLPALLPWSPYGKTGSGTCLFRIYSVISLPRTGMANEHWTCPLRLNRPSPNHWFLMARGAEGLTQRPRKV